jgi:DnaJ domain
MSESKLSHRERRTPEGRQLIFPAPADIIGARRRGSRKKKTLYDVLGVQSDADDDSIERAYRQAIKAYHPDLHGSDPASASLFQEIVAAAAVLRDPNLRAGYDRKLRQERRRRREWALAAILGVAAAAIIGAGRVSGRLVLFSDPATTISEPGPPVAAEPPEDRVVDRKSLQLEASNVGAPAPVASGEPAAAPVVPVEPSKRRLEASEIALLIKRGEELMASGNIGAARSMFQLAAEAGEPAAALALAETYDPSALEKLGVKGVTPDLALARRWYEKAKAMGSTAAATGDWWN